MKKYLKFYHDGKGYCDDDDDDGVENNNNCDNFDDLNYAYDSVTRMMMM